MSTTKPAIGFVGLGAMGFGMATHLVRQGYPVYGFDLYAPSVQRFQAAGGIAVPSLRDSARDKQFYVCMVASAPQAQSVLFGEEGIVDVLPPNATLLLASTVPASYAQSVSAELQSRGRSDIFFIDCPVSGGAKRAADGTLSIMAGGSDEALQRGKFLLQTLSDSNKLYLVPGGVGAGSNMKMVHQVLAAIHILGASEAMGFAARLGLDATQVAEAIKSSDAWTWMHENRLQRMLEEDWNPGASALTIILKDVGIITASARQHQFPTPLSSTAEQIYLAALSQGFGSRDDSAMVRQYFPDPIQQVSASKSAVETEAALQLVLDLMRATNLCAAAEAIAFARFLNVDLDQFYQLVNDAAGASRIFTTQGLEMIEGRVGDKATQGAVRLRTVTEALEKAIQAGRDVTCPLHLGHAALSLLLLAQRAEGDQSSASVIRIFN
ncbi:hypothetical protein ASPZODRAFT_126723 [Penicilliopsis zonata CBS 506.65]|uniref:6-phosphogluconate dehydrogenase NADP-binding domain-containing protein n=1 Tax=Penicilliopsis zonata CBS 506.65 TaxID=1073090 RepID=A0A1L9SUQ6_9EURO|nr:hypothetical protein ASPZODRAFT_126723 [Penicilliopsis zonata CBS 506.65]OJJ50783.1 hypothetical protein ASPZODRAFT_126723 [Penicilliopsis zonata CBS 506.65]